MRLAFKPWLGRVFISLTLTTGYVKKQARLESMGKGDKPCLRYRLRGSTIKRVKYRLKVAEYLLGHTTIKKERKKMSMFETLVVPEVESNWVLPNRIEGGGVAHDHSAANRVLESVHASIEARKAAAISSRMLICKLPSVPELPEKK